MFDPSTGRHIQYRAGFRLFDARTPMVQVENLMEQMLQWFGVQLSTIKSQATQLHDPLFIGFCHITCRT